jgi:hypothetical protein
VTRYTYFFVPTAALRPDGDPHLFLGPDSYPVHPSLWSWFVLAAVATGRDGASYRYHSSESEAPVHWYKVQVYAPCNWIDDEHTQRNLHHPVLQSDDLFMVCERDILHSMHRNQKDSFPDPSEFASFSLRASLRSLLERRLLQWQKCYLDDDRMDCSDTVSTCS